MLCLQVACGDSETPATLSPAAALESVATVLPAHSPTPDAPPTQTPRQTLTPSQTTIPEPIQTSTPGTQPGVTGVTPAGPTDMPGTTPSPAPVVINETDFPLSLPSGFRISLFTPKPMGAIRFMAFSPDGILFVSRPSTAGLYADWRGGAVIALPDSDQDGVVDEVMRVIEGLRDSPHGLAFYGGYLYLAEHSKVSRYPYLGEGKVGDTPEVIVDLPFGRGHLSRTLGIDRSDKMYVSIGSSCNLCEESDQRRATLMEYNPDGSGERVFAEGVRNSVGFVFHPGTGEIWATENGRDNLGDDLPPDEINILRSGQNYGWPYCYGKNIPDPAFDDPARCSTAQESLHDLQAHSAPLGLRFVESSQFPDEWQGDLLVAYHGSWNRREPTGYKVVRLVVDGSSVVAEEDFIKGWMLDNGTSVGRPVDLIFGPQDGALYISDDKAGVIYRVTRVQ